MAERRRGRAGGGAAPDRAAGLDGDWLRRALAGARDGLDAEAAAIDDLNVFPVPDGDTGTNLVRTLGAACEAVARLGEGADLNVVGRAAAHGSLMGARGNSGVILSQFLRGFAQGVDGGAAADPGRLASALGTAATAAERAVLRPQRGTILTVARDAADAGRAAGRLGGATCASVLGAAAAEAWAAVARTPSQLPVLAEAGVVDAGGYGLAVVVAALAAAAGSEPSPRPRPAPLPHPAGAPRPDRSGADGAVPPPMAGGAAGVVAPAAGYGYCTEFQVTGGRDEPDALRARLAEAGDLGDSALVVGDRGRVHVHVHTREPWRLLAAAAELGAIERLTVADMTEQHRRVRGRSAAPAAPLRRGVQVVAVAPGPGFGAILLDCGAAAVVPGGPGQPPSRADLEGGIRAAGGTGVVLLPNHPDVLPLAEQVERAAGGRVAVVASRSVPQGIAALLAADPELDLAANRDRMERAMAAVRVIEIATAGRDGHRDGRLIHRGDLLAMTDGRLAGAGTDLVRVAIAALEGIGAEGYELVTLYRGGEASAADAGRLAQAVRERFPGLEVEQQDGGQRLVPFVISAE
ncbi:MAG TPA: DAK2 domain-containing protein [Candidatus Micrarchaeia archaeon]|nr:DAK2 domain-containing protein [Candidatus Micrarchaeia archaeon]